MKDRPTLEMLILLKKQYRKYENIAKFLNISISTVNRWYRDEGLTKKYKKGE